MVCGAAPSGFSGEEAEAGGMLGHSLGLSGVISEGKEAVGKEDEGFPLFVGIFTHAAVCPGLPK